MYEYVLSLVVENDLGVLARIASVFRQKMINIKSLHVEETIDTEKSIMNIRIETTPDLAENVKKVLAKKEDVYTINLQVIHSTVAVAR